ncbi:MAG: hypothetical protein JSW44_02200, partial [Candidatus Bathyarchaeota archaeon]
TAELAEEETATAELAEEETATAELAEEETATAELAEEETATAEPTEEQETPEVHAGPLLPEPPVTQLMVENIGGFLVRSDTVRIDNIVITKWNELFGDKKIEEVDVETLDGITTRCKFKPIKDKKHKGKGVIRMPEDIQRTLETAKGELVMVKPVVE